MTLKPIERDRLVNNHLAKYSVAIVAVAIAVLLRLLLRGVLGNSVPFITFFPAIILAGWYGGLNPAGLATVLSALCSWLILSHADTQADFIRLIIFTFFGCLISWMAAERHKAHQRTTEALKRLEASIKTQELTLAALRQVSEQNAEILSSISDGVVNIDHDFRYSYANEPALRLLKKRSDELIGQRVSDVFPDFRETITHERMVRALSDQSAQHWEEYYGPLEAWVDVSAYPSQSGITLYIRDTTEQRRANDALRESELRYRALFSTTPDGILFVDGNGVYVDVNESYARMLKTTRDSLVGRNFREVVPPESEGMAAEAFAKLQENGDLSIEFPLRTTQGDLVDIEWRSRADILPGLHLCVARDITDRKRRDAQLRETQKLESLGVIAGGVAHDFNNLLLGVMGNASLVRDKLSSSTNSYMLLTHVLDASQKAAQLTSQLLAYAGKGKFVTEPVDLSRLVGEISALITTSIPKDVHVSFHLTQHLPKVTADPGQLQQIVMNLVINAAEAIDPAVPGTVVVTTAVTTLDVEYINYHFPTDNLTIGRYVVLEVHDNGIGMSEETKAKIFDPFFTTKFLGRGLGLAAVLGIVRGHRGALRVYTNPGKGTTFKVLFPADTELKEHLLEAPQSPMSLRGTGTVLIVDDEPVVATTARAMLENYGYQTLIARDGRECLDVYRANSGEVAVVLLDVTMPVMSGEEALGRLRVINPTVRVIVSSGYNEVESIRRFTSKGISGFVQKPYTGATLAAAIKNAIEDPRTASAPNFDAR
jgi:PAS domain S-box-containing protein